MQYSKLFLQYIPKEVSNNIRKLVIKTNCETESVSEAGLETWTSNAIKVSLKNNEHSTIYSSIKLGHSINKSHVQKQYHYKKLTNGRLFILMKCNNDGNNEIKHSVIGKTTNLSFL